MAQMLQSKGTSRLHSHTRLALVYRSLLQDIQAIGSKDALWGLGNTKTFVTQKVLSYTINFYDTLSLEFLYV